MMKNLIINGQNQNVASTDIIEINDENIFISCLIANTDLCKENNAAVSEHRLIYNT